MEIFIVGQLGLKRETMLKCQFITDSCESTRNLSMRQERKKVLIL